MPSSTRPSPEGFSPVQGTDKPNGAESHGSEKLSLLANSRVNNDLHKAEKKEEPAVLDLSTPIQEKLDAPKDGKDPYIQVREVKNDPVSYTETTWSDGPNKGTVQRDFPDGRRSVFKDTADGGRQVESFDKNRKLETREKAKLQPDGTVRLEHTNFSDTNHSYTAILGNGSLKIDYSDGRHLERTTDANRVVHTTMTGKNPWENFTATEKGRDLDVKYADGSVYRRIDGKNEVLGKDGKNIILGIFSGVASASHSATFWQLNGAFWITLSQLASDVRDRRR